MTSLTQYSIYQAYGDILTTTNGGQGLSSVLQPVEDGLGNMSPMQISLTAVNFLRTGMNTFQLDGINLTASATNINAVAQNNPILPGTGGMVVPKGTTAERYSPPTNGVFRYNTSLNIFEGYVNGSWDSFAAGAVSGPNSSTIGDIAIFSDTTGQVIADSGVSITQVAGPLLGPPPPGPLVTETQLSGIDILSYNDVGLIFTGSGTTEEVYVCGFHPNTLSGKFPNTVFGFANPSSPDAVLELTQGAFLVSRLSQTTINSLIDIDGMIVYNEDTDAFNFRQNGSWVDLSTGSVTSILGTANEITATGSSTVTIAIADNPILPGTASVTFPSGTTGQRPGSPTPAMFRYNTTSGEFEGYNGSWITFGTGSGSVTSITAGSNLTGGTITTSGTIALSNTPTGLTSIGVGNLELIGNQIISTDPNGNIDLLPNGTGSILLGAAPVTITSTGILTASILDAPIGSIDDITCFNINMLATGGNPGLLSFYDANNSNFVALTAPSTVPSNFSLELPSADGTTGQALFTNGTGSLSFNTVANRNATFIVQNADASLPFAVDLYTVAGAGSGVGGILKVNNAGVLALAVPDVDYGTVATVAGYASAAATSASAAAASETAAAISAGAAAASAGAAAVSASLAASYAGSITGATSAKFIIQEPNTNLPNAQSLSTLSAGILKNTIVGPDGVLAIATAGTDYYAPTFPTTLRESFGNVFVGNAAGNGTLSGGSNTAMGFNCLSAITSAGFVTCYGAGAGNAITTGGGCTLIGFGAGGSITTAFQNTFVGISAGSSIVTGASLNVGVGPNALGALTTGNQNTAVGDGAGNTSANLSDSVFFGYNAQPSVNGLSNCGAIGSGAQVGVSNALVLGNGMNVGIGTTSPVRGLTVLSGQIQNLTETATSYTVLDTDLIVGVTSTAVARTITLPTAAAANKGQIYTVKDESGAAATNNITVNVTGGGNIDGAASAVINTNYGILYFYSNGTQWYTA